MKKTLTTIAVLAAAVIALPIFAEQKKPKPTVTPAASRSINLNSSRSNRVVQPAVTPSNAREVALGGPDTADRQQQGLSPTPNATGTEESRQNSKSAIQNIKAREQATVAPPGSPEDQQQQDKQQQKAQRLRQQQLSLRGRVLSQQGRRDRATFTVLSNGKEFTFSAAKTGDYWVIPKVGDTVEVTYSQTPGGTLEAVTVRGSKSNSDN